MGKFKRDKQHTKKTLANIYIPTTEELDCFKDKRTSKSIKKAIINWINHLEEFRAQAGYFNGFVKVSTLSINKSTQRKPS
ncbi:hypothetical protein RCL_jg3366.t1 [Rhizophagus clarus]|nr:hypothetical protein RCL_jg3366.t1 [Rhizophagus clarus]